ADQHAAEACGDEEDEVCNVHPPACEIAKPGHPQTLSQLNQVGKETGSQKGEKETHPEKEPGIYPYIPENVSGQGIDLSLFFVSIEAYRIHNCACLSFFFLILSLFPLLKLKDPVL